MRMSVRMNVRVRVLRVRLSLRQPILTMVLAFSNCTRRWRFRFVGAVSVPMYPPPRHLHHLAVSV